MANHHFQEFMLTQAESDMGLWQGIGWIFLAGYIVFAIFVTHRGDFYQRRQWKGAICESILILMALVTVFMLQDGIQFFMGFLADLTGQAPVVFLILLPLLLIILMGWAGISLLVPAVCLWVGFQPGVGVENLLQPFAPLMAAAPFYLLLMTLLLFLTTLWFYRDMKWSVQQEKWLDVFWKDPNKGKRSPIEWI
ncbi:MAG TPA: hypothetical protein PKW33_20840 [Anaerolineaceae bacterium]|nr:hypothetical protein [Anaerolineaceae bacterium]HPN54056.1 hypothetical protein [Anaerolineaceae bacterium]